jgi:ABC-type dipeptide/oligopeptide/nickel transport system permease subunit
MSPARNRKTLFRGGAKKVLRAYCIIALSAPLLASHDPLMISLGDRWHFPAFSNHPYLILQAGEKDSLVRKSTLDWRTLNCQGKIMPLIAYSPFESDAENSRCISPFGKQFIRTSDGHITELPVRYRHWLGTTSTGRDVASLLIHGCRTSMIIGLLTLAVVVIIGVSLGTAAGWFGNDRLRIAGLKIPLDLFNEMINAAFTALPRLVVILVLSALLPRSLTSVILLLGLTSWNDLYRLTRTRILQLRSSAYIEQAVAAGTPSYRILFRHVGPNLSSISKAVLLLVFAHAVIAESSLTFLGAGLPPTTPSWGQLLLEARSHPQAWWLVIFPAAGVFGMTFSLYRLSERR